MNLSLDANNVFEYNLCDYVDIDKFITDEEYATDFKDYLIKPIILP